MAEYGSKSDEEMASLFITSTCQLLPKSVSAVSDNMHNILMTPRPVDLPSSYWIFCGSAAEFYFRPMNACIDDTDALISQAHELAFSGDFPVLPSDLSGLFDTIHCFKIESYYKYPGFVRLRVSGELNYNWKCKKFEFNDRPTSLPRVYMALDMATLANLYLVLIPHMFNRSRLTDIVSGPSIKCQSDPNILGSDNVRSLFYPQWPIEAKTWPIRPRKNGWPTIDTISKVVENGCHVVYVQHRSCREDKQQWRLSFSVAEVILIQSWTQVQQIVYHLLRFFAKRVLIEKDCPKEDEILCPYHLKTLMLWTCEEMPSEWWNSSSVIAICSEILKKLLDCLKTRCCPNYFIPEANLFNESSSSTMLEKTEIRISEFCNSSILSHWFIENYLLPVIHTYFKPKRTTVVKPNFVCCLVPYLKLQLALTLESVDLLFSLTFKDSHKVCRGVIKYWSSSGLRQGLRPGYHTINLKPERQRIFGVIPSIDNELCFIYFDNLLFLLHTAYSFSCGEVSLDSVLCVELINKISMQPKIIRSQYHNFPKTFATQSSRFQFLRAHDLMQNLTGSNSRPEFQLVSIMSKEFLRKALKYDDSQFNGIASAALTYLSALHFATSEYQEAMRLCLAVLACEMDMETLNAGCLLFIDDIARIVGFYVLHKKITENNLHYINRRLYLDLRLSPKLFAHCLAVLSVERMAKHLDFDFDLPNSAFPMDEYLNALIKPKYIVSMKSDIHFKPGQQIVYRGKESLTETESSKSLRVKETAINALVEYALVNMTSFYNVIRKEFGIRCNTADCYRALYLYKCRNYSELLNLCERILHQPDLPSDFKEFAFANVLVIPPIDSFFDGDIQSLLGFHTLFYYLSPLNDDMKKCKCATDSTFEHWFEGNCARFVKVELTTIRIQRNSIKCRYFLGRHFLARYLKVKCCIDCNLPYTEAMTEFAAQKTNLPFEFIIRRFLLQKLRIIKNNSTVSSYQ